MLTSRFEILKMEETQYFIEFYTELQVIVNSKRGFGKDVLDSKVARKIIRSLPKRFHPKVIVIKVC